MLYNLDFLNEGQMFPPKSEISRLKKYSDNEKLFDGRTEDVLKFYKQRIQQITDKFKDIYSFKMDINYFRLITLKLADLVCGEPPTISCANKEAENKEALIKNAISNNKIFAKLIQLVYDISIYGNSIVKVKQDKSIILNTPTMWFPVVEQSDIQNIIYHCLCWIEEKVISKYKKEYILNVQIHNKGSYEQRKYNIKNYKEMVSLQAEDGENITCNQYEIGELIEKKTYNTGLKDFAVVDFSGVTLSKSIYGIDDYDNIVSIVAELEVRYALESVILDKHSAPTMYGPDNALGEEYDGEAATPIGGYIPLMPGDIVPGYATWDAALQANHTMIEKLEKLLFSLSEMGAVINDDSFGASQGFEALQTRMTNALLKARRLAEKLTDPLKKLLSLITNISEDEISIYWNNGLPNDEYRDCDVASKKSQFFSTKTILKEQFGKSDKEAEDEIEQRREEQADSFSNAFMNNSTELEE